MKSSITSTLFVLGISVAFGLTNLHAQTPAALNLTAKSANVAEPGTLVRINILRWSTAEERVPVVAAMDPLPPAPAPTAAPAAVPAAEAEGDRGGAARGGRGGAAAGGRGAGARGGGAPGGRGGGAPGARGGGDPISNLTAAIGRAPTIGYIWTNEVVGYSIKYASRATLPGGGERIILATDRRLGSLASGWKPTGAEPATNYEFTVLEMRLDAKGIGEGKTSLTTKVVVDNETKTIALENYDATPALLQNIKR